MSGWQLPTRAASSGEIVYFYCPLQKLTRSPYFWNYKLNHISNVLTKQEDAGWGPNAVFRFPREGGTGAIWKKVAKLLPEDKQRYNIKVVSLDLDGHCVTLDSGKKIRYQKLLSTIPLDITLRLVGQTDLVEELHYSSTHIVGIGLRGVNPHDLKCWLYYPEDDCPFYRCTIFSHYAKVSNFHKRPLTLK